ncbi:MAG: glycosyltransferase family 4 protein [Oceanibaculum nanhaiense]|uniref:glycosyltransferase family 4 protein n=1 Tax=Oceanibaculum nanhaiense TaxID=1909734 RepID=UPI0025A36439|nr:glycosyltransferase family 4 protein [Oceanibaculum nanhaiense]MDM7947751.1 glycosyltransferase family 4 protein [Oceanibaculum nanhaiense]
MKILHITPHLGGGVGRALSCLIRRAAAGGSVRHALLCLEQPEKRQAIDAIAAAGCPVTVAPTLAEARAAIDEADIVQVELWNHPEIPRLLCALGPTAMRLLTWCHVSGLGGPRIPPGLSGTPAAIVFTSPCSLQGGFLRAAGQQVAVVSSASVDHMPALSERMPRPVPDGMRIGYVGTLDFSKLHPDFVDFLAELPDKALPVHLYGDNTNQEALEAQCRAIGRSGLLRFHGHVSDIAGALAELDVLAYPLDPAHYGTAENALVEAMAMGVVPVVLDNPAERCIVSDGETGFVVRDKDGFRAALRRLLSDPEECAAMARRASATVRARYTARVMEEEMNAQYRMLMRQARAPFDFHTVFGQTPGDWYLSFQPTGDPHIGAPATAEARKGSVHHFLAKFPGDPDLERWAGETLAGRLVAASFARPKPARRAGMRPRTYLGARP